MTTTNREIVVALLRDFAVQHRKLLQAECLSAEEKAVLSQRAQQCEEAAAMVEREEAR